MASFGSGLAHALTSGVSGYGEGRDDRMRELIALAAQKRAQERLAEADRLNQAKFQHDVEQDRRSNLINGLIEGDTEVDVPTPATTPDTAIPPINRTFDDALNERLNNVSPTDSSLTRTPNLGTIPHVQVRTRPDVFDPMRGKQGQLQAAKDQEIAERQHAASEDRRTIAELNNQTRKDIAGQNADLRRELAKDRQQTDTSWQTVTTADGSMVQVNPKTGATRPIGLQGKTSGTAGAQTTAQKNKSAEIDTTIGTIDEALGLLAQHPKAVGLLSGRGVSDVLDQWVDPKGVAARAAMASVSSNLLHALSGAAISPKEYQRLRQYVPVTTDRYDAAVVKLRRLKNELDRSRGNMNAPSPARPVADGSVAAASNPPRSASAAPLTPSGGISDADLWEQYVAQGMSKDEATRRVKQRRR